MNKEDSWSGSNLLESIEYSESDKENIEKKTPDKFISKFELKEKNKMSLGK